MENTLEFGLNAALPAGCPFAWGARAIWNEKLLKAGRFDLLNDRQGRFGADQHLHNLTHVLNKKGALAAAAKDLHTQWWSWQIHGHWPDSTETQKEAVRTVYTGNGYVIQARIAGGYIYLAAYPDPNDSHMNQLYPTAAS